MSVLGTSRRMPARSSRSTGSLLCLLGAGGDAEVRQPIDYYSRHDSKVLTLAQGSPRSRETCSPPRMLHGGRVPSGGPGRYSSG
jgi:hypothetical protein